MKLVSRFFLIIAAIFVSFKTPQSFADEKLIRLASLEWPPYSSKNLPGNGAGAIITREAFRLMGYRVEIDFFPLNRSVALVAQGRYDGYFPQYLSKKDDLIFSNKIGDGQLGFVERKSKPISWTTLGDLKRKYLIGVINGYEYTEEFATFVANGDIVVKGSAGDAENIRNVIKGRVDAAIIDKNTLAYYLTVNPSLKTNKGKVAMNARLLETKGLHVAFNPAKKEAVKAFDEGLSRLDIASFMKWYISN